MLSPRFGASSDDVVADQSALMDVAENELQPDPNFASVGSPFPTELPDSPTVSLPASSPDPDLSLILADVAAAMDGGDTDLVGAAEVGITGDGLTEPAIAPLAVGLLPGTVRVTGTTLEFTDAPLGFGGDNNLIVTALGSTLLIEDTQNNLIAGAGTTAVSGNQVSVDLTGITRIALDGGTGEDRITIASNLSLGVANLSLTAETLRVNDGVIINTLGDIVFSATETGTELDEVRSPVNVEQKTATIAIGQNVSLNADDISLRARAADTTFLTQLGTNRLINDFIIGPIASRITDLAALPVKVLFKQSDAAITVGSNTQLLGTGDVTLDAVATANATGSAISSLFSIGYAEAEASAIVDLATGVNINAGGRGGSALGRQRDRQPHDGNGTGI